MHGKYTAEKGTMTMKKMKNFIALLLALVMTMSLMACGNKTDEETKTGEDIGCYVQTTETGEKVLVDKDGNAVTNYTLDDEGNVVDTQGVVVVKAADITAYEKSEEKDAENKTDASEADTQKHEDTAKPDGENKSDAQKTDAKGDDTKKDEQKPDTSKKDDVKQDEQKPADTAKDTTPESKAETPNYGNGTLTTSQVKEMQRWYGVSADGQWGAGSAKAAGGRTADEAWAYYQSNKQITTPETPSGGNTGNTGSTGGGSSDRADWENVEVIVPTPTGKADIDCAAAVAAGNAYAESIGFEIWSGCRSYFPPVFLERDCPESCWNQEWVESAIKQKVDYVKETAIRLGRWSPVDEVPEGCASAVNCVVRWNASAGYHEIYVYYAA